MVLFVDTSSAGSDTNDEAGGASATSRDRLVRAASELFWRQGVAVTSPRQVMVSSGVGKGSLYHHFPGKQDLARAAISTTVTDALATARRELTGDAPARDRLRAYLARPRDALAGCRVGRLVYEQYVIDHDVLHTAVREYFTTLLDLVREVYVEQPGISPEQARQRAYAAVAVLQGGYVLSRALGDPEAMTAAVSGFLDLLDEGYRTPGDGADDAADNNHDPRET